MVVAIVVDVVIVVVAVAAVLLLLVGTILGVDLVVAKQDDIVEDVGSPTNGQEDRSVKVVKFPPTGGVVLVAALVDNNVDDN